eukprot:TRINITY_DN164896_c0_g1_i1.p1 TRINITY_DN164896_c0_g1~~TRINITY_DN164896_c0_g1_i1.p1  ORF type:complete len:323 (+),score=52.11 TRINITY_DN164896_c0_g1_i1:56-1024(+)
MCNLLFDVKLNMTIIWESLSTFECYFTIFAVFYISWYCCNHLVKNNKRTTKNDIKCSVIWITGSSSGIGKAVAISLSCFKVKLVLSGRNISELALTKEECISNGALDVLLLPFDSSNANFEELNSVVLKKFGRIDKVILAAGISTRSKAEDSQIAIDRQMMEINYFGTIGLAKSVLNHFLEHERGHFVVISSMQGKISIPFRAPYAASKKALHGFFDSLRAEVAERNVFVSLCCPAYVKTNLSMNALTATGEPYNEMDATTANGYEPSDLAEWIIEDMIFNRKSEVIYAPLKHKVAIWLEFLFPRVFENIMKKRAAGSAGRV